MVDRGSMISRGMVHNGSSMVCRCSTISMGRKSSGCVHSSGVLFVATIAMYRLWGSMGLADHRGVHSAMGLVHRVAHRGGISLFDGLVVGLVCCGHSQQGSADESLHFLAFELIGPTGPH